MKSDSATCAMSSTESTATSVEPPPCSVSAEEHFTAGLKRTTTDKACDYQEDQSARRNRPGPATRSATKAAPNSHLLRMASGPAQVYLLPLCMKPALDPG